MELDHELPDVNEGADLNFVVRRAYAVEPATKPALSVSLDVSEDGDVIDRSRFTTPVTVTIPADQDSVSFAVPTDNDDFPENSSKVTASIRADAARYRLDSSAQSATATVHSQNGMLQDRPRASIRASGTTAVEGVDLEVTVTRNTDYSAGTNVRLNVSQQGDVLAAGETGERWVYIVGETSSLVVRLPTKAGSAAGGGSVTVDIVRRPGDRGYFVGDPSSVTVTMVAKPVVTVEAVAGRVVEGNDVQVNVFRDTATDHPTAVTLRVSVRGNYLSAGGAGDRVVTIARGARSSTVLLATSDDQADESAGSVTVTALPAPHYEVGDPAAATTTLDDNDGTGRVTFRAKNANREYVYVDEHGVRRVLPAIAEGVAPVIEFTRRGAPLDQPLDLVLLYARQPNLHGRTTPVSITIPAGRESVEYTLDIAEGLEIDGGFTFGRQRHWCIVRDPWDEFHVPELAIHIIDADAAEIVVHAVDGEVSERRGSAKFQFRLNDFFRSSDQTLSYHPVAVTVTQDGDVLGENVPTEVLIHRARNRQPFGELTVPLDDDEVAEQDGTITVTVVPGDWYKPAEGAGSAVTVVRDDDYRPFVTVTAPRASVTEGTDSSADFTVSRDGDAAKALTVTVQTAHSDRGSTTTASHAVTLAQGEHSAELAVDLPDDALHEDAGAITATVQAAADGSYRLGETVSRTVAVTDDDEPAYLAAADAGAPESAGSVSFTVALHRPQALLEDAWPVTVAYRTADGTAQAGTDYTAAAGSLTFQRGDTGKTVAVTVAADDDTELPETFTLDLSNPGNALLTDAGLATYSAIGTIVDRLQEISIGEDPLYGNALGEGLVAYLLVHRHGVATDPVTVDLEVAFEGDYRADATERLFVTFAPGETRKQVAVETNNDTVDEPDGALIVTIVEGSFIGRIRGAASFRLTLRDNDPAPRLELRQVNGASEFERAGPLVFEAALIFAPGHGTEHTVTVNYATANGTATAAADYTAVSGTLTFEPGTMRRRIAVPLLDDTATESEETLRVALSNARHASLPRAGATAGGTIRDDEGLPAVGIAVHPDLAVAGRIAEGADARFVLNRSGAAATALTVGVRQTFTGYYESARQPLHEVTFATGAATLTVAVPTRNDQTDENDGAVAVALVAASAADYTVSGSGTATLRVTDDDPEPQVYLYVEGRKHQVEAAPRHRRVSIRLDPDSEKEVTVSYATANGTATAGTDYVAASGTVTFPAGRLPTVRHYVGLLDDDVAEDAESFDFTLSNAVNASLDLTRSEVTLTIVDDDHLPAVEIDWGPRISGELWEGFQGAVELTRAGGDNAAPLEVTLQVAFEGNYSARWNGVDISGQQHAVKVVIPAGESSVTAPFAMVDNGRDQSDGWLTVAVAYPFPTPHYRIGDANRVRAPIRDDDPPPAAAIRALNGAAGPEAGAPLEFEVVLLGDTEHTVTVSYATADGTALAGADYRAAAGTLKFAPGRMSRTIAVALLDDQAPEQDEHFTVSLRTAVHARLAPAESSARGTINADDDHLPRVTAVVSPAAVTEGAQPSFRVRRTGSTAASLAVNVELASEGDFAAPFRRTTTIGAGQDGVLLQPRTVDDAVDEADGALTLTVLPGDGYRPAVPASAVVSVRDDDPAPALAIRTVGDARVAEGAGHLDFAIGFASEQDRTARTVQVAYTVIAGTAAAGTDYVATDGIVALAPGERAATVRVAIAQDDREEADETFMVRLRHPAHAVLADAAAQRMVTATIVDDDAPVLSIRETSSSEQRGLAEFPVTLDRALRRIVSVDFVVSVDGAPSPRATAGSDFVAYGGTVVFSRGVTRRTISVVLSPDSVWEGAEYFTATLSNPVGGAVLGVASATGQITDYSQRASVSAAQASVQEGADAVFDFRREVIPPSGGERPPAESSTALNSMGEWRVPVRIAQTGTFLADAPGELWVTFPSGATSVRHRVATVDDDVDEDAGTVTATLFDVPATTAAATVQVTDNDRPLIIVSGPEQIIEGEDARFVVAAGRAVDADLQIRLDIAGHVKMFTPATHARAKLVWFPVTLPAGSSSVEVVVATAADQLNEGDGELKLIVEPHGDYRVGGSGEARVLVKDDDIPELTVRMTTPPELSADDSLGWEIRRSGPLGSNSLYPLFRWTRTYYPDLAQPPVVLDEVLDRPEFFSLSATERVQTLGVSSVHFHAGYLGGFYAIELLPWSPTERGHGPYGPQYTVGAERSFRVTLIPARPTVIVEPERAAVTAGEPARFRVRRYFGSSRWDSALSLSLDVTGTGGSPASGEPALAAVTFPAISLAETGLGVTARRRLYETPQFLAVATDPAAGNGTVTATIRPATDSHRTVEGYAAATVRVLVADDSVARVAIGAGTAAEAAGSVPFTVTRSGASAGGVTVSWETADGGCAGCPRATAGSDYTAVAGGVLTLAAGRTSATIAVAVADDTDEEGDEYFRVDLTAVTGGTLANDTAWGTILDDDGASAPAVTVTAAAAEVVEGQDAVFTVTRTGSVTVSLQAALTLRIDGVAADDPLQAAFPIGLASVPVAVPTADDAVLTAARNYEATVQAGAGYVAGDPDSAVVNVVDNDGVVELSLERSAPQFFGLAGTTVNFSYTVTNGGDVATDGAVTVQDDVAGAVACGAEPVAADTSVTCETQYTVTAAAVAAVTISSSAVAAAGEARSAAVAVTLTHRPHVAIGDVTGPERGVVAFPVTLTGSAAAAVTVDWTTRADTAAADVDFTAAAGTLSIAAGATGGAVTVAIADDRLVEDDEEFAVVLSNAANADLAGGAQAARGTGAITDDDERGVTVSPEELTVTEGGSASYTVVLTSQPTGEVTVTPAVNESADASVAAAALTFDATSWSRAQTVSVGGSEDDDARDGAATISHAVAGADYGANGVTAPDVAVTVTDDDEEVAALTLTIEPAAATFAAVGDAIGYTYGVLNSGTVTLSGTFTIADDTVTGVTCTALPAGGLEPGAKTRCAGSHTVVQADVDAAAVTNTATATIAATTSDAATATVAWQGAQRSKPSVSVAAAAGAEGGAGVSFTVTLSAASAQTATVAYATAAGTAAAGTDYTSAQGTLTFAPGSTARTIVVAVLDDAVDEEAETLLVTLSAAWNATFGGGERILGATGTIDDDDTRGVRAQPTALTIPEGAWGSYTVVLESQPTERVTVTPSAAGTLHFDPADVSFAPASWNRPQTVGVRAAGTGRITSDVQATIAHAVSGGDYQGLTAPSVRVTLKDKVEVSIAAQAAEVTEGSDAVYVLTRDGSTAAALSVGVQVQGHRKIMSAATRALADNRTGADATVTFANNAARAELRLTTQADSKVEGDGLLTVSLAGNRAYSIDARDAEVLVRDDDIPELTLEFSYPAGTTVENGRVVGSRVEGYRQNEWVVRCSGEFDTSEVRFVVIMQHEMNHPSPYFDYNFQNNLGAARCDEPRLDSMPVGKYFVGPANGENRYEIAQVNDPRWPFRQCEDRFCPRHTLGTPSTATIRVINRHPTITVAAAAATVAEGAPARFELTRHWNPENLWDGEWGVSVVALRLAHTGGYVSAPLPESVTFGTGETRLTVEVPTVDDELVRGDGAVTLELLPDPSPPSVNLHGNYEIYDHLPGITPEGGSSRFATVAIADNDSTPVIAIAPAQAAEAGLVMEFPVTLSDNGQRQDAATVQWRTVDGTAVAGQDYTAATGALTFAAGHSARTLTVALLDDQEVEPREVFSVELHGTNGAIFRRGGRTAAADGTIVDDDAATGAVVSIATDETGPVAEDGGSYRFAVRLAPVQTVPVTVHVQTVAGGTATEDVDYVATTRVITFAAGETEQPFTVSFITDVHDEPDETFLVRLSLPAAAAAALDSAASAAMGVIADDDERSTRITLTAHPNRVAEGGGAQQVAVTAALDGAPRAIATTVSVAVAAGTAVPADFTAAAAAFDVVIAAGHTRGVATFTLQPVDDAVDEADETVAVTGDQAASASEAEPALPVTGTTVTIADDDRRGIELAPTSLAVREGGGSHYTVQLTSAPTAPVRVRVQVPAGAGIVTDQASVEFTAETWRQAQTVAVIAYQDVDAANSLVTIAHTSSGGDYTGQPAPGLPVTVTDDDTPTTSVRLAVTPPTVSEAVGDDGSELTVTATLDGAARAQPTVVAVTVAGKTASAADFAAVSPLAVTIPAASVSATGTFTLQPVDDAVDEADETVAVTGATAGLTVTGATAIIVDDDARGVVVAPTALALQEGASTTYAVSLTSAPDGGDVVVSPSASVQDGFSVTPAALTFTAADWATAATVTVTSVRDADAADATVTVSHQVAGADYAGQRAADVVVQVDDRTPRVAIGNAAAAEGDGAAGFAVSLDQTSTEQVTVAFATTDGTAKAGADYTAAAGTLTFAPGATAATISVTVTDDTVPEVPEVFRISLSGPANAVLAGGGTSLTATAAIADDDLPAVTVTALRYEIVEGATAVFAFARNGDTSFPLTVTVAITEDGAMLGAGEGTMRQVTFLSGASDATALVRTSRDAVDEVASRVTASVLAGTGYAAGTPSWARVSVADDDVRGVTVTPPALTLNEGASDTYTVVLTSEPTAAVTVTPAVDGDGDVTVSVPALTFTGANWRTAQTVTVRSAADDDADDDAATILHTAAGADYAGTPVGSVKVTVTDDDEEEPELTLALTATHEDKDESGSVTLGDVLTYRAVTTNSGNVRLSAVTVSDALLGGAATECASLAVGAQCVRSGAHPVTQAEVDAGEVGNSARASAIGVAEVTASVNTEVAQERGLSLTIAAAAEAFEAVGDEVSYTYTVSNSGTVTLSGTVTITDDTVTGVTCAEVPDGGLAPAAKTTCTGTYKTVQADVDAAAVTNTATASLASVNSGEATATVAWHSADSEPPVLSVMSAKLTEADADLEFAVNLSATSKQTVTVAYATADDSAQAGADYGAVAGILTFAPGATARTVAVTVREDELHEADETFRMQLSQAWNAALSGGGQALSATGTIADNEDTPVVSVLLTPASIGENGEVSAVTARLSGTSSEPTTVTVSAAGVEPAVSSDYAVSGNTVLSIAAGQTASTGTLTIEAADNHVDAPDKSVTVSATAVNGLAVIGPESVTLTITDDDQRGVTVSPLELAVTEGGADDDADSYTVVLMSQPTGTVTVTLALSGDDHLSVSAAALTFDATSWSVARTVTLSLAQDDDADDETAMIAHGVAGADYDGTSADAVVVSVSDDDEAAPGLKLKLAATHEDKDASGSVTLGDVLSYTALATNSGNVRLAAVTVSDALVGAEATECGNVPVAAECSWTGAHTVGQADVDAGEVGNTARASATGVAEVSASVSTDGPGRGERECEHGGGAGTRAESDDCGAGIV